MSTYPIFLDLTGRRCVIVGGGRVACRKLQGLLAAGARVTLVAPTCLNPPENDDFEWLQRPWRAADLDGAVLVFAATDDALLNREIASAAASRGIPVNLASDGAAGDFQLPAVRCREGLTLAVSTGGKSPALAALLADELAARVGPEWQVILALAAALRDGALTGRKAGEYNQSILRQLLDEGLERFVAEGRVDAIDGLLQKVCGADTSLGELGIELPGKRL